MPSTRAYNVQCMATGSTYQTDLDELARAMESGNPMRRKPYNEVAWGQVRLFFELDGSVPTDLETRTWVALRHCTDWRRRFPTTGKTLFGKGKTLLRSSKGGSPRFHLVYPAVILTTEEYCRVIEELQPHYPQLDKTCNGTKAWLRFPKAPKRDEGRTYHLVKGTYRNAFINAHSAAGLATKVSTRGVVGQGDAALIYKTLGVRIRKGCYIEGGRRTYFTKGKATCIHGTVHNKRPVTIHVKDTVYLGRCSDPECIVASQR